MTFDMKKMALLAILLCSLVAKAQEEDRGPLTNELWTGVTAKMKIKKDWRLDLEQQFRFRDTLSTQKSNFTELSLNYRFNKRFKLKANYRHTRRIDQRNRNRVALSLYYNWKPKKTDLSVQYRFSFQNDYEVWTEQQITLARNRILLDYNLSKLVDPFFGYESFYRFNYRYEFRTNRFTFGLDWRLNKDMDLKTFYRIEQEINVKVPERQNVFGLMLIYSFKLKDLT